MLAVLGVLALGVIGIVVGIGLNVLCLRGLCPLSQYHREQEGGNDQGGAGSDSVMSLE